MGLTIEEIKERFQYPRNKDSISRAIMHQNRIKFHVETQLSAMMMQPTTDFLNFVSNLLPADKFRMFKALFRFPVKTNEITGIAFDKLSRVFDGRNPAYNYQFYKTEERDDWEYYRKEKLNEPQVWSEKGWEYFKTEINSVLIVDLPAEMDVTDKYPQPYFYWLDIANVISFEADKTSGVMDWIIFRQDDDNIAAFDDEYFRLFHRNEDGSIGELLIENPHELGYCPAKFFWNDPLSLANPHVKESPITKQLESLDWYLFQNINKRHLDTYASYPILSAYEENCNYANEKADEFCDHGFLRDRQGNYKYDPSGTLKPCPICGKRQLIGPGSLISIPIPNNDDQPDLRNPVQILTVDRDSLDYNVEEQKRLKNDIITAIVGTNEEVTTRQALNEQQVKANFESQSTILNRVKKGFEAAENFVDATICRLRYGTGFISARVNLGTEFYVYDVNQLRERYKLAKESGASEAELDALQYQIIETEYRHDITQLNRMLVLADIEPYRHLTREEMINLRDKGIISDEELKLKLNFSNFVRRFERENTNILEFGNNIPYSEKINIIKETFKTYVNNENKQTNLNS